jgi:hypothetical protein
MRAVSGIDRERPFFAKKIDFYVKPIRSDDMRLEKRGQYLNGRGGGKHGGRKNARG